MSRTKGLQQRIIGKTKQAVGEILGDQDLHEDGKAQAESGRDEQERDEREKEPSPLNPLKKLKQLT
ncbi:MULTISPECIES: CsbD family protein [unclassified Bradyrhizobium]|uniref:CsbD family protein n=1 Tax=unclassified Bradyrhizobium TaxID=2631580 RepID=UPI00247AC2DC|nr:MULTISPECIES: CsbD family protein [unclassified Bradyrhizobium]WGR67826.1 CsbD family protein [Bradyrhizobium sp. ISRA426]WGR79879.1 CsbD family protein [Bradyrhizobium sp. ISRA430]WGR83065.1 CsbD family protein [Bradyrhizobium sp. ISRA432]